MPASSFTGRLDDAAIGVGGTPLSVHRLNCGGLIGRRSQFEQGVSDELVSIPVYAWLVRHPRGAVLFDTGMSADLIAGGSVVNFEVDLDSSRTVAARLIGLDIDPNDIETVVVSHRHFDHVGGSDMVPNARLLVRTDEMDDSDGTDDIASGHPFELVRGDHDVFGDGRVVCIPTPGHTRGHQSLRVRLDDDEVVLAGDCCYFRRTLHGGPLPPLGYDLEQQSRSVALLRSMERAGAYVVPGHDATVAYPPPRRGAASGGS